MAEIRRMRPLLGTFVEIGADGGCSAQQAVSAAFDTVETVQRALSFQDPDSELSRLNGDPESWVPMSRMALHVLRLARAVGRTSGGSFNCTVGGQLVRWGLLPSLHGGERLPIGSVEDVELRPGAARLRRRVLVTLDGIAKGYAVDRAVRTLRQHGVLSGWVNGGGDARIFGNRRLQILQRGMDGTLRGPVLLENRAIASSSAGRAGGPEFPARVVGAVAGVERASDEVISVLAGSAWRADALTKVAAAAPPSERAARVRRLGGRLVEEDRLACSA